MFFSPLKVVLCGALFGGTVYGTYAVAGGGQSVEQAVKFHKTSHNSRSEKCTTDACDHLVDCSNNQEHVRLPCGHVCLSTSKYLSFLTQDEKNHWNPKQTGTYHESPDKCPSSNAEGHYYRSSYGYYSKCST
ncbi:hypothetical protein MHLP_01885 [Candidatus Mycoplasma haematolamae str. Purdue]|uniref:Uncharacterized protein n=1 Tax=Mycoplasma haematolamae (strain Purdue) TaxID=1212765 RepID=I7C650_MYCHA|nr:hypothetical protein [Candidatus Mycoplasma haematolamae]AFO51957.1 hypothetical protein MHLP_01885 [Candidatus Mycoplasma haematolamae str. Purdue]